MAETNDENEMKECIHQLTFAGRSWTRVPVADDGDDSDEMERARTRAIFCIRNFGRHRDEKKITYTISKQTSNEGRYKADDDNNKDMKKQKTQATFCIRSWTTQR